MRWAVATEPTTANSASGCRRERAGQGRPPLPPAWQPAPRHRCEPERHPDRGPHARPGASSREPNRWPADTKLRFTQWVYDVLDTWLIQSEGEEPPAPGTILENPRFGMISVKDRQLLQEALDWRCDAFLTMERRLPTAAAFVEQETGLRIMRPTTHCGLLDRWAQLYR